MQQDKSIKPEWGKKQLNLYMLQLSFCYNNGNIYHDKVLVMILKYRFYSMTKMFSFVFLMTGWWGKGKSIQLHSLWNGTLSASKRWCDPKGSKPSCPGNAEKPWWNEEGFYRQSQEDWHHLSSLFPISLFDF